MPHEHLPTHTVTDEYYLTRRHVRFIIHDGETNSVIITTGIAGRKEFPKVLVNVDRIVAEASSELSNIIYKPYNTTSLENLLQTLTYTEMTDTALQSCQGWSSSTGEGEFKHFYNTHANCLYVLNFAVFKNIFQNVTTLTDITSFSDNLQILSLDNFDVEDPAYSFIYDTLTATRMRWF
jgi:hypothetical protein